MWPRIRSYRTHERILQVLWSSGARCADAVERLVPEASERTRPWQAQPGEVVTHKERKDIMTAATLRALQKKIDAECLKIAQSNYLTNADVAGPMFDGVPNEELYLKSWPRVLWILQEPHDTSASEQGRPKGNWSVPKDMIKVEDYGWNNKTHEPIAKVMYAFRNQKDFHDVDTRYKNARYNPDDGFPWEVMGVLQSTAWINVSKMPCPNGTNSNFGRIRSAYIQYWRDVVIRQVNEIYQPNIIVVAGKQWEYVADDLADGEWHEESGYPNQADRWCDPHGRQFVWVDHPTARKGKCFDSWVKALCDAQSALKEYVHIL